MKKTSTNLSNSDTDFAANAKSAGRLAYNTKTALFAFALLCSFFIKAQTTNTLQVPSNGTDSIPCGQITLLQDDGGSNSYSSYDDGYTVITPGLNSVINLSGPYDIETPWDAMLIWEGVGTNGNLLATVGGFGTLNFSSLPGQTITVEFMSDCCGSGQQGFDLTVTFPGGCSMSPCSGTPATESVIATYSNPVCPSSGATMSVSIPYNTNYGITYTWQMSTGSALGPWVPVSNPINSPIYTTTDTSVPGSTTYYSAVVTCVNGNGHTQAISAEVDIATAYVSNIPYYEGFEGLTADGQLPNCSWMLDPFISTYTTNVTNNTYGHNSQNYLSLGNMYNYPVNNVAGGTVSNIYTNGLQLYPGVTYSASIWYLTDSYPGGGIDNISIYLNSSQTSGGGSLIVKSPTQPYAPVYTALSNTFMVSTAGVYYMNVALTRDYEQYPYDYLTMDDFSVIAPCSLNSPSMAVSGPTTVCSGNPVNFTATGADTYLWSNGSTNAQVSIPTTQAGQMTYAVVGTNTASACSFTVNKPVNVVAGPVVAAFTSDPNNAVCLGSSITLYAVGSANTYVWNTTGTPGANTSVAPTASTVYSVTGTNATNCSSTATISIAVNDLPTVGGSASKATICSGEAVSLSGSDPALTYSWVASSAVLIGSPVTAMPTLPTNYQLFGTDPTTGCTGNALVSVNVDRCLGITNISASNSGINVYPNPNNGEFTVELNNSSVKTVQLVDVTGRVLMTNTASNGKANFNISNLAGGIYYVKTQSSDKTEVVKVVKQ